MIRKTEGYVHNFLDLMRSYGLEFAVERFVRLIQANLHIPSAVARRRITLSKRLFRKFGGEVRYGPLQGLRLRLDATWGAGDRAGMLLGLYEKEVVEVLAKALCDRAVFIDIGAADGYYAVGLLNAGLCEKSIAFEMSAKARESIGDLARLNNVSDRLTICGAAREDTLQSLGKDASFEQCVVLCDIEGAEVTVLNENALRIMAGAIIVIELHPSGMLGIKAVESLLRQRSEPLFDVTTIHCGARAPLEISEISAFDEDDQWLICSEGRGYRQSWLVLRPKIENPRD